MTKPRDPDALLSAYLAVGMEVLPDRVVDSVLDEGHLDRVLGEVGIAQDPMRDEDAAVADLMNQGAEGLLVALSRLVHDGSQHPRPPGLRRRVAPSTSMSVGGAAIVRYPCGEQRTSRYGWTKG